MSRSPGRSAFPDTFSSSVLNLSGLCAKYVWIEDNPLPAPGCGVVFLEAKAENDIHVCLHPTCEPTLSEQDSRFPDTAGEYEFNIGGMMNTKSILRKGGNQVAVVSHKENPDASITNGTFVKYWFSIDFGFLSCGKGSYGDCVFLSWMDPEPANDVRYFGVSTWDTPIQYRHFFVTSPPPHCLSLNSGEWRENAWRFLQEGNFVDTTLRFTKNDGEEQMEFQCHLPILATGSNSARELLEKMEESRNVVMELESGKKKVSAASIEKCIRAIYEDSIALYPDELESTWDTAALLRIPSIESEVATCRSKSEGATGRPKKLKLSTSWLKNMKKSADFFLRSGNEVFPCHRVLLASQSDLFCRMFLSEFSETHRREADLSLRMEPEIIEALIDFMYCGVCQIDQSNGVALLVAASELRVFTLKKRAEDVLSKLITFKDACEVLPIALALECLKLKMRCLELISSHYNECSALEEFHRLTPETMGELLRFENIHYAGEIAIFEGVSNWYSAQLEEEKSVGCEECFRMLEKDVALHVLPRLQFHLLPPRFIRKFLESNRDIAMDRNVRERLELCLSDESVSHYVERKLRAGSDALTFSKSGDDNGVLYFIGTDRRTDVWRHPLEAGYVKITCSSRFNRFSKPKNLVDRLFHSTSFFTSPDKEPWVIIDVLESGSLLCSHYTLCHDGSADDFIRSWNLEGKNPDDERWTVLRAHRDDSTISTPAKHADFSVSSKKAFRQFRIILKGATSSGSFRLVFCSFELYGNLFREYEKQ